MLTDEQLATIKLRREQCVNWLDAKLTLLDFDILLAELTRLQSAIKVKDAALAQFSDSDNWYRVVEDLAGKHREVWDQDSNPIDLAERAMVADGSDTK